MKIVTGDNELVIQHFVRSLASASPACCAAMNLSKWATPLCAHELKTTIYSVAVNPAQKNRIILALKQRGHTVGYLGDGINDAPALRRRT